MHEKQVAFLASTHLNGLVQDRMPHFSGIPGISEMIPILVLISVFDEWEGSGTTGYEPEISWFRRLTPGSVYCRWTAVGSLAAIHRSAVFVAIGISLTYIGGRKLRRIRGSLVKMSALVIFPAFDE